MSLKEISISQLNINPCTSIGQDWMLISAGDEHDYNTMTASWGHIGALWGNHLIGRPTVEVFVRPTRYTDKFIDNNDCFTLCFFDEAYKKDLLYLGSHSGQNEDKISKTSLTPSFIDNLPIFKEAKLVIIAKKIYKGKITEDGFIEKSIIKSFYDNDSYHNVYIGEILKIFVNE